jgi:hypothetical protein
MKLFFTAILSCMVLTAHAGYRYIYNPKIASRVIRPAATETSI